MLFTRSLKITWKRTRHREKCIDNLYRLKNTLTKPKGHKNMRAETDLPKNLDNTNKWRAALRKNKPRLAPLVRDKLAHDTMKHSHRKVLEWFRKEYPDAMKYMESLSASQIHQSCPLCTEGKAKRASSKQQDQNRLRFWKQYRPITTGSVTPADTEGNRFVQILLDACSG